MSEYDRRAADPCWQHKQTMIMMTTLVHIIQVIFGREDGTYYWQHCRKNAEDDIFVDANDFQLELFGTPHLSNEYLLREIYSV